MFNESERINFVILNNDININFEKYMVTPAYGINFRQATGIATFICNKHVHDEYILKFSPMERYAFKGPSCTARRL